MTTRYGGYTMPLALLNSYQLWTNDTTRELLTNEYPWFLRTYDNYKYPIQRADSIRYFILAHYGGIYVDLDNVCNPRERVSSSIRARADYD